MIQRGKYSYGNPTICGGLSKVIVGNFCSISDFSKFDCGFLHPQGTISTFPFNQKFPGFEQETWHPTTKGDIIIGNDVWICDNVIIMSGVKIGNGATIAAGAV